MSPDAKEPSAIDDSWFDQSNCLNCSAPMAGAFCSSCGQKKAARLGRATVRSETWSRLRWFEWDTVRNALRVISRPGRIAREYVLGRRKNHMHPMTLLLLLIGLLLLVLAHIDYLKPQFPSEAAMRMYELVRS